MTITLGYIHGISRTDTPSFISGSEQILYFESKKVSEIETTFYPPHYQNDIYVEDDDCDINTHVNYLWFTYKDKVYYYFIDSIEYSSESVLIFHVTMDYIQTFMFNIQVVNGVIERKSIERWYKSGNRYLINRNYIRENPSCGLFKEDKKSILNEPEYWLVVKYTGGDTSYTTEFESFSSLPGSLQVPYAYAFLPLKTTLDYIVAVSGSTETQYPYKDAISYFLKKVSPYIVDAYVIPISPAPEYLWISGDSVYYNSSVLITERYPDLQGDKIAVFRPIYTADTTLDFVFRGSYYLNKINESLDFPSDIDFTRNTELGMSFDTKYCPVLLDENFLEVRFGNDTANVSYPLHLLPDVSLQLTAFNPVVDGMFTFKIHNTRVGDYIDNDYLTTIIDTNKNLYDIIVDTESQYIANNRNRWVTAGIQTGLGFGKDIISTATYLSKISALRSSISAIPKDINNLDKRTKKYARLKSSKLREMNKLGLAKQLNELELAESIPFIGSAMPLVNQAITDNNMKYAPDSVKQTGNVYDLLTSSNGYIWSKINKVYDLLQCAKYFECNGYKVDEYIMQTEDDIFSAVKIRNYYNILKLRDSNIHLRDYLEDDDTISAINDRMSAGLRLWNTRPATFKHQMVEFVLDNWYVWDTGITDFDAQFLDWKSSEPGSVELSEPYYDEQSGTYCLRARRTVSSPVTALLTVIYRVFDTDIDIGEMGMDNVEINNIN